MFPFEKVKLSPSISKLYDLFCDTLCIDLLPFPTLTCANDVYDFPLSNNAPVMVYYRTIYRRTLCLKNSCPASQEIPSLFAEFEVP
jgi:hypothetical protein